MKLSMVAAALHQPCSNDMTLSGLSIDSRQVKPGELFLALQGERLDGHRFIADAVAQGAAAIVCRERMPELAIPQLVVPDTQEALALIAMAHREHMTCPVVALTGSNGKTTVKEMVASILPKPAFATPGNLNNHIGVPLSLLSLNKAHRYAVFELGANHPGDIAQTVALVKPDVTLINNIGPAHLAGFGSIDGVARAKGEIHQGLAMGGTAVINADDAYAHAWDDVLVNKRTLLFSRMRATDIHARDVQVTAEGTARFVLVVPEGESAIQLQVCGLHNVSNALAAAAAAQALGISLPEIVAGLSTFTGVAGRLTYLSGKQKAVIIDDTYNANLRSTLAALEVLAKRPGRRIFIFGDLGELGEWTVAHHEAVGLAARELGVDMMLTCGSHSEVAAQAFGVSAQHCVNQDDVVKQAISYLDDNTTVLVKGSRAAAMEKVVCQLIL